MYNFFQKQYTLCTKCTKCTKQSHCKYDNKSVDALKYFFDDFGGHWSQPPIHNHIIALSMQLFKEN